MPWWSNRAKPEKRGSGKKGTQHLKRDGSLSGAEVGYGQRLPDIFLLSRMMSMYHVREFLNCHSSGGCLTTNIVITKNLTCPLYLL